MFQPKAGGFDAVWLLVCEPPEDTPGLPPLPRIERLWTSFPGVAPLLAQESKVQGVALEKLHDVPGLAAVVYDETQRQMTSLEGRVGLQVQS